MSDQIRNDPLAVEFREKFRGDALKVLTDEYNQLLIKQGGSPGVVTENQLIAYAEARHLIGKSQPGRRRSEPPPKAKALNLSAEDEALLSIPPTEEILSAIKQDAEFVRESAETGVDFEKLFAEFLGRWNWSQTLRSMFEELGQKFATLWKRGQHPRLTPEIVMLVILQFGQRRKGDTSYVAATFADIVNLAPADLSRMLDGEIEQSAKENAENELASVTAPRLNQILGMAKELTGAIARGNTISVRHLIAALLLPPAPGMPIGASCNLPQNAFPARAFAEAFIEHVKTADHIRSNDRPGGWNGVIRDLETAASIKTGSQQAPPPSKPEAGAKVITPAPEGGSEAKQERISIGGSLYFARTASDEEVCLRADDYADVLKTLLANAGDGEFCFALFGHWGRGKTFLMKRLAKVLEKENYETIFFSAWKYPKAPEVWVHLYETFARAAYPKNLLVSLPRLFRAGVAKNGTWQIIAALLGLLFALWWPKGQSASPEHPQLGWLKLIVGAGSVAWMSVFVSEIRRTAKRLRKDFLTAKHYTEKLGLQAVIGKDLRALLEGWIPHFAFPRDPGAWCGLVIAWALGSTVWWHLDSVPTYLRAGVYFGVILLGAIGVLFIFCAGKAPSRVLLVVDDLDRCTPEQLLAVMESVKLLIEEPKVSARVQVAMLIEEDILKHAILKKYRELKELNKLSSSRVQFTDERLIMENCEKLFSAHLRLPPLSGKEMGELMDHFALGDTKQRLETRIRQIQTQREKIAAEIRGAGTKKLSGTKSAGPLGDQIDIGTKEYEVPLTEEEEAVRRAGLRTEADKLAKREAEMRETNQPQISRQVTENQSSKSRSIENFDGVLSDSERQSLRRALETIGLSQSSFIWGPRSIRSLYFRYQLARLLLIKLGGDWEPQQLAAQIVSATVGETSATPLQISEELKKVVSEVS